MFDSPLIDIRLTRVTEQKNYDRVSGYGMVTYLYPHSFFITHVAWNYCFFQPNEADRIGSSSLIDFQSAEESMVET